MRFYVITVETFEYIESDDRDPDGFTISSQRSVKKTIPIDCTPAIYLSVHKDATLLYSSEITEDEYLLLTDDKKHRHMWGKSPVEFSHFGEKPGSKWCMLCGWVEYT